MESLRFHKGRLVFQGLSWDILQPAPAQTQARETSPLLQLPSPGLTSPSAIWLTPTQ